MSVFANPHFIGPYRPRNKEQSQQSYWGLRKVLKSLYGLTNCKQYVGMCSLDTQKLSGACSLKDVSFLCCLSEFACCPVCLWFIFESSVVSILATLGLFSTIPCRDVCTSHPPPRCLRVSLRSQPSRQLSCWVVVSDHSPVCGCRVCRGLLGVFLHVGLNQGFFCNY